jgi:bifunctional DNA-binding transcriptional regulator/antitoxin component of YhaV-PrlF toxin-antitoxin module
MTDITTTLRLRRINQYTVRLTVPSAYLRNHGLKAGDKVLWIPDADGVRLKFVKVRQRIIEYELEEEMAPA